MRKLISALPVVLVLLSASILLAAGNDPKKVDESLATIAKKKYAAQLYKSLFGKSKPSYYELVETKFKGSFEPGAVLWGNEKKTTDKFKPELSSAYGIKKSLFNCQDTSVTKEVDTRKSYQNTEELSSTSRLEKTAGAEFEVSVQAEKETPLFTATASASTKWNVSATGEVSAGKTTGFQSTFEIGDKETYDIQPLHAWFYEQMITEWNENPLRVYFQWFAQGPMRVKYQPKADAPISEKVCFKTQNGKNFLTYDPKEGKLKADATSCAGNAVFIINHEGMLEDSDIITLQASSTGMYVMEIYDLFRWIRIWYADDPSLDQNKFQIALLIDKIGAGEGDRIVKGDKVGMKFGHSGNYIGADWGGGSASKLHKWDNGPKADNWEAFGIVFVENGGDPVGPVEGDVAAVQAVYSRDDLMFETQGEYDIAYTWASSASTPQQYPMTKEFIKTQCPQYYAAKYGSGETASSGAPGPNAAFGMTDIYRSSKQKGEGLVEKELSDSDYAAMMKKLKAGSGAAPTEKKKKK